MPAWKLHSPSHPRNFRRLPRGPQAALRNAISLTPPPAETDDLSRFKGYDAVVVTWTAAEAAALAALLTPAHPISSWYEYRHGIAAYLPLVTGAKSPFNDQLQRDDALLPQPGTLLSLPDRKCESPALQKRTASCLRRSRDPGEEADDGNCAGCQSEGFHHHRHGRSDRRDVLLGDVVVGGSVRFDCTAQFKNEPWHNAAFTPSPLAPGALNAIILLYFSSMHHVCPTREALRRYGMPRPMPS